MCARYTLRCGAAAVGSLFDLDEVLEFAPRYNIAPTQDVPGVVANAHGTRVLRTYRWGLIPRWADDLGIGQRMINARSESLQERPAFRDAFRQRRCLLPADGFYEWVEEEVARAVPSDPQASLFGDAQEPAVIKTTVVKQPYHIRRLDGRPFAFAGLWDAWTSPEGHAVESCTVVTTEPNDLLRPIHDRMPVILSPDAFDLWLDPEFEEAEALNALLVPCDPEGWEANAVSPMVGNPRNEDPRCLDPR